MSLQPQTVRLVIPDTGVLISLAHGNLLDVLLDFADTVDLVITDVVEFEATKKAEQPDAQRIASFLGKHADRITVEATSFHEYLKAARENPGTPRIPNIGELSIYGFINQVRSEEGGVPTLVLFEDNWFVRNQFHRPTSTHLVSLCAFLKLVAQRVPDFSYKQAIEAIRRARPGVNLIECDDPGKNDSTKTKITWKAAYAQR